MAGRPNGSPEKDNILIISSSISTTPIPVSTTTPEYDPREYYKTYDVMTGVRIAATLGSFFGLMVLLVLYKSKSKTEKALEDPNFTAAAVAEVEEEERQIQLAMEVTAYQQLNPRRSSRRSLDTSSMPAGWNRGFSTRFSSVGGYSNLMDPPIRTASRLPSFVDEDSPPEDGASLYDEVYYNSHLDVPRRPSNITCSSSGSSYLERRDSAVTLGLSAVPAHKFKSCRRQSSPLPDIYDLYYPIDIKVTQPTPGGSPCGSNKTIYNKVENCPSLNARIAPLASISSCNSSLGTEGPESEGLSYVGDSAFQYEEDTDNEIDPFSTDSDVNSEETKCDPGTHTHAFSGESSTTILGNPRFSPEKPSSSSQIDALRPSKSSSILLEDMPLPQISLSYTHKSASSSKLEKCSWAQETLF